MFVEDDIWLKSEINEKENHLYHKIIALMYILCWFMCIYFDPDKTFRIKNLWENHPIIKDKILSLKYVHVYMEWMATSLIVYWKEK